MWLKLSVRKPRKSLILLEKKIGFVSADPKEFATFVDPLANPKQLAFVKSQLKHVQTRDNSNPVIEKDIHIIQNHHKALFAQIKQRSNLKHTKITNDASAPCISKHIKITVTPRRKLFADIREHNYQLKPVNTNDRSFPRIPKDVHKKFNEKPAPVLPSTEGILSSALNTAKTLGEKTTQAAYTLGEKTQQVAWTLGEKTSQVAHSLEEKIGYKFIPDQKDEEFVKFVDLLATPKDLQLVKAHLKHVQTRDNSKPVIGNDVHIKNNHHGALFAQIRQRPNLKHVEKPRDASAPFLDKKMHIKESPQKKLFVDIREHHYQLRPVETKDKSLPFIPRDAHIEKSIPAIPSTSEIFEAGKEKLSSAINTAKQVTYNIGEKTQQTAKTIGEKTSQAAHTLGEKTTQAAQTLGEKTTQAAQTLGEKTQQAAQTIGEKTTQAAHTIGEKTQQAAQTIGEKTSQATHSLEDKIGYKFTPGEQNKGEFVKFVDPVANPKELENTKSHLKHTQTRDKSKPVIENVHIKENHHKELLAEIEKSHDLNHVRTEHDASKPFIDKDIHIGEAPQKKILEDITQQHQLKHVKMNDKSAPFFSKDVHIGFVE